MNDRRGEHVRIVISDSEWDDAVAAYQGHDEKHQRLHGDHVVRAIHAGVKLTIISVTTESLRKTRRVYSGKRMLIWDPNAPDGSMERHEAMLAASAGVRDSYAKYHRLVAETVLTRTIHQPESYDTAEDEMHEDRMEAQRARFYAEREAERAAKTNEMAQS